MIQKVPDSHRRDRLGVVGVEKAPLEGEDIVLIIRDFGFYGDMCFRFNLGCPCLIKSANFLIKPKKENLIWVKKKKN